MVKITAISDLHGYYPKLPGGDLLIVAGDLTARDTPKEHCNQFVPWLKELNYKKIIVIAGNHDNLLQQDECLCMGDWDGCNIEYLCDSGTEFEGLKIWGSPWTFRFCMSPHCMAFTGTESKLKKKFDDIPCDTDILITHGPPYGILDKTITDEKVGSLALLKKARQTFLRYHIFGHIHEAYGTDKAECGGKIITTFINCSHVNEWYKPVNKPVTFEI